MKTPMQILLEKIENGDFLHPKVVGEFIKYNLLDKEKEFMKGVWLDGKNSRINGQDPMEQIKKL